MPLSDARRRCLPEREHRPVRRRCPAGGHPELLEKILRELRGSAAPLGPRRDSPRLAIHRGPAATFQVPGRGEPPHRGRPRGARRGRCRAVEQQVPGRQQGGHRRCPGDRRRHPAHSPVPPTGGCLPPLRLGVEITGDRRRIGLLSVHRPSPRPQRGGVHPAPPEAAPLRGRLRRQPRRQPVRKLGRLHGLRLPQHPDPSAAAWRLHRSGGGLRLGMGTDGSRLPARSPGHLVADLGHHQALAIPCSGLAQRPVGWVGTGRHGDVDGDRTARPHLGQTKSGSSAESSSSAPWSRSCCISWERGSMVFS